MTEDALNSPEFQGKINGISTTLESMLNILKKADGPLKQITTYALYYPTYYPTERVDSIIRQTYYCVAPFHKAVNDDLAKLDNSLWDTRGLMNKQQRHLQTQQKQLKELLEIEQQVINESIEIIKPNVDQQQNKTEDQQQNLQKDSAYNQSMEIKQQVIPELRPKTKWEQFTAWCEKFVKLIWPKNRQENINTNQVVNGQENLKSEQRQAEAGKQKNQYQKDILFTDDPDPDTMKIFSSKEHMIHSNHAISPGPSPKAGPGQSKAGPGQSKAVPGQSKH